MRAYRVFLEVRLLTRLARTPAARNAAELSKIVRVLTILRLEVVIAAQRARHSAVKLRLVAGDAPSPVPYP
jgi:hypothetical protein